MNSISKVSRNLSEHEENVARAFSRQSGGYDEHDVQNPILQYMRNAVRKHVLSIAKPESKILELNAGTGLDAAYFASNGFTVHATDVAQGMVSQIQKKIAELQLFNSLTVERQSFLDLSALPENEYDFVFSNFGGLNCAENLEEVIKQLSRILKRDASVCLVLMPKICPWEWTSLFKGNAGQAFRRLKSGGVMANVEGVKFRTVYYPATKIESMFGRNFKKIKLQGIGSIVPPPHHTFLPQKFPLLFKGLTRLESKLSLNWPFNIWADHYILSMQFRRKQ
jgi:ubiquinone/menaquinone biosynthesis C-methylase UbiE